MRRTHGRAWIACADDHVHDWLLQQQAGLDNLKDALLGDESSMLAVLRAQTERARANPAAAMDNSAPPGRGAAASSSRMPRAWHRPVAHMVGAIPAELVPLLVGLSQVTYPSGPQPRVRGPAGGWHTVYWDAAPRLVDPDSGDEFCVARHDSLEQALLLALDGDVVLLAPGRYNLAGEAAALRRSVRIVGCGPSRSDCVLYNGEDDGTFVEARGPSVVLENLTLLQLGGYDGIVQVLSGTTTLIDCVLQCSMTGGGAWLRNDGVLEMYSCKVFGASSSAVQVEAGGARLELHATEITQCGNGDDVVPRDLGAVDVQVRLKPLAVACLPGVVPPVMTADDLRQLLARGSDGGKAAAAAAAAPGSAAADPVAAADAGAGGAGAGGGDARSIDTAVAPSVPAPQQQALLVLHVPAPALAPASSTAGRPDAAAAGAAAAAAAAAAAGGGGSCGCMEGAAWDAALASALCALDTPATVVIGPGCKIHGNRGFALSVVKPRALALLHEASVQSGGSMGGDSAASPAASGAGPGGGGGAPAGAGALAVAVEGARVYVAAGAQGERGQIVLP
ncbi:hypothetical protein FOA52_015438 [Chlamydomonas sp. UWO 241]|nr:hypothetical protein FOA52_015438 [Chlamydomonas sp. UWO 241]